MLRRTLLVSALSALVVAGCGQGGASGSDPNAPLRVGVTPVPHAEMLEAVKPILAKEGVQLDVRVFNDYVQPNIQLHEGRIDANFFEVKFYIDDFNAAKGAGLQFVSPIHLAPMGGYSQKHRRLEDIPAGAVVSIPNDPVNGGRALLVLHSAGLIRLKDPSDPRQTVRDILDNPKRFSFREVEAPMVARTLNQVDLAMVNTNFALDAGLNPVKDALFIEPKDSPYANLLVSGPDNREDPRVQALARALHSQAIKDFVAKRYEGAILIVDDPAFDGE